MPRKKTRSSPQTGRVDIHKVRRDLYDAAKANMPGDGPHERIASFRHTFNVFIALLQHPDCPESVRDWADDLGYRLYKGDPVPDDLWRSFKKLLSPKRA